MKSSAFCTLFFILTLQLETFSTLTRVGWFQEKKAELVRQNKKLSSNQEEQNTASSG